eukprot:TRINITY_DN16122_c0_g1_i3.p1 TRINITY_DN16122_c0_g1~~TRINITY_DN16122_c0_g1_i3.p1  ORF type:complete len:261 (+),score=45.83 TRINITY_DN16122_c0_g1_i3:149-931(+)
MQRRTSSDGAEVGGSSPGGAAFAYEGAFHNNRRHGHGILRMPNLGLTYVGEFAHDVYNGKGVATFEDGSYYTGSWLDGKKSGWGEAANANGCAYKGEWQDGHRHGYGCQEYEDGSRYEGFWENGLCSGQGKSLLQDGSRYEGGWRKGRHHGKGVLTKADGSKERLRYKDGNLEKWEILDGDREGGCVLPPVTPRITVAAEAQKLPQTLCQVRDKVHRLTFDFSLPPCGTTTVVGFDLSAPSLRQLQRRGKAESPPRRWTR